MASAIEGAWVLSLAVFLKGPWILTLACFFLVYWGPSPGYFLQTSLDSLPGGFFFSLSFRKLLYSDRHSHNSILLHRLPLSAR